MTAAAAELLQMLCDLAFAICGWLLQATTPHLLGKRSRTLK
jgi:hypothetical protein